MNTDVGMADKPDIRREICVAGLTEIYRSSAKTLAGDVSAPVETIPLQRDSLYRFDGDEVLLTTRSGQTIIGRLRVTETRIEIGRIVEQIPCRHRIELEEIASCCMYYQDDAFWDAPTQPQSPAALGAEPPHASGGGDKPLQVLFRPPAGRAPERPRARPGPTRPPPHNPQSDPAIEVAQRILRDLRDL
ncbi:MAG: hypothetical protein Tsb0020_53790 [Haliangiales bacterium]